MTAILAFEGLALVGCSAPADETPNAGITKAEANALEDAADQLDQQAEAANPVKAE